MHFARRLATLGIELPFDETLSPAGDSPLGRPLPRKTGMIGNRFAILPMEGWDGERDGRPSD